MLRYVHYRCGLNTVMSHLPFAAFVNGLGYRAVTQLVSCTSADVKNNHALDLSCQQLLIVL